MSSLVLSILARDQASTPIRGIGEAFDDAADRAGKFKETAGKALAAVSAAAGVGIGAGIAEALNLDAANDKLAAQLGLSEKESARIGKVAGSLYVNAYGDSMDEVNAAVGAVTSSIKGMNHASSKQLEAVTATALNFATAFEIDVTRAAEVAGVAIQSGLAKNGMQAFDLLTAASQKVPAALREDVLDASEEYSQFFAQLGFSGKQAFAVLVDGAKKGQYGIDKAGDAVKEFTIRSTDMSTTSQDAYKAIGLGAKQMASQILKGGDSSKKATDKIIDGILGIQDPVKRANVAIALFGTPIEDLSTKDIPKFLASLKGTSESMDDVRGAAGRMGDTLNDNAQSSLTTFTRSLKMAFVNILGGQVIPFMEKHKNLTIGLTAVVGTLATVVVVVGAGMKVYAAATMIADLATRAFATAQSIARNSVLATRIQLALLSVQEMATATAARFMTTRLASAAGGILLLADASRHSTSKLGALETAAGGALLGFSVGGPWGAAIGAGAGALYGLSRAVDGSSESLSAAQRVTKHYMDTLDQMTAKVTEADRRQIFKNLTDTWVDSEFRLLDLSKRLGVANRDLVLAVSGNGGAMARVIAAVKASGLAQSDVATNFLNAVRDQRQGVRGTKLSIDEAIQASKSWRQALRSVPKKVRTKLEQEGYAPNLKQLRALQRQYHLTPKQIQTIIKAVGIPATVKDVLGLHKAMKDTDKIKPHLGVFQSTFLAGMSDTQRKAYLKTGDIVTALKTGTGKAKANLDPFRTSVVSGVHSAQGPARSGGISVGAALQAGVILGFSGTQSALASQAAAAVNAAVAAAKRAAQSRSPSRKTMRVGESLGDGLTVGLKRSVDRGRSKNNSLLGDAGRDLIRSLIKGIDSQKIPVSTVLDKLHDYIRGRMDRLRDLLSKRNDVVQSMRGFSESLFSHDFTNGGEGSGPTTAEGIIAFQQRERAKARRLSRDVTRLRKLGLSNDLIKQLIAGGESGQAQIHALAQGTKDQIAQLNALNQGTQQALTNAGMTLGNELYGDDIAEARRQEALAKRIEKAIERAIKNANDREVIIVRIGEQDIVTALKRYKKRVGHDLGIA